MKNENYTRQSMEKQEIPKSLSETSTDKLISLMSAVIGHSQTFGISLESHLVDSTSEESGRKAEDYEGKKSEASEYNGIRRAS
jgi:hypothetical protein